MIPADTVRDLMETYAVPGVAVGVLQDDAEEAAASESRASSTRSRSTGPLFQIGSITKTFTATAAMRLVEQGRLDLDEPVRAISPSFAVDEATASAVAMRHLLCTPGGWVGDYFDPTAPATTRWLGWSPMADLEQLTPLGEPGRTTTPASTSPAGDRGRAGETFEAALQRARPRPARPRALVPLPRGRDDASLAVGHVATAPSPARGRSAAPQRRSEECLERPRPAAVRGLQLGESSLLAPGRSPRSAASRGRRRPPRADESARLVPRRARRPHLHVARRRGAWAAGPPRRRPRGAVHVRGAHDRDDGARSAAICWRGCREPCSGSSQPRRTNAWR